MKTKKCGCIYDGPVQVVTCGKHNVAAKNLDRAQVMITQKDIEIHHLKEALKAVRVAPSKPLDEMTVTEKTDWAMGNLTIAIGRGDFRNSLVGIIMGIMSESFDRGVKSGIERESARWKEREKRRRARAR